MALVLLQFPHFGHKLRVIIHSKKRSLIVHVVRILFDLGTHVCSYGFGGKVR
jgi:hypothetical protein